MGNAILKFNCHRSNHKGDFVYRQASCGIKGRELIVYFFTYTLSYEPKINCQGRGDQNQLRWRLNK